MSIRRSATICVQNSIFQSLVLMRDVSDQMCCAWMTFDCGHMYRTCMRCARMTLHPSFDYGYMVQIVEYNYN